MMLRLPSLGKAVVAASDLDRHSGIFVDVVVVSGLRSAVREVAACAGGACAGRYRA